MKHRFARLALAGVSIVLITGPLTATTAPGSAIDDKRAEAEKLQREIDANGNQIEIFAERYNDAQLRLDGATREIAAVEARLASARANTDRIRELVKQRAASLYRSAGGGDPLSAVDVADVQQMAVRSKYASTTADRDRTLLDRLARARQDLGTKRAQLEAARQRAQSDRDAIDSSRREVDAANAKQLQLLSRVKGELATLIAQEQARRAAAEKARSDATRRRTSGTTRGGHDPGNVTIPNVPAPSPGAAAAVAYAKAQLGKPYRYAGVGPDAYDCSGLTMMAWAQGGVSMPHGAAAQGAMFPRVPDDQLQPGDLTIYYADHHHVAIYVGDGMTIAATHTGDYVRLQPVFRSGYQFAVRPG